MAKLLNRCPICGDKLEYSALMQYSDVYTIKRNGELSAKSKKSDAGSMECGFISCVSCDFVTDCDLDCTSHKNIKIWMENGKYFYETGE